MRQTEPTSDLPNSPPELPADQFDRLVSVIDGMPSVFACQADTQRTPRRLDVCLDGQTVPDSIRDLLDQYGGEIVDASVLTTADGPPRLRIDVVFHGRAKGIGYNTLREWGSSKALTVPAQALEASGFTVGDKLAIAARAGELKLTQWKD